MLLGVLWCFRGVYGCGVFWVVRLGVLCGWECASAMGCDIGGVWRQVLSCGWGCSLRVGRSTCPPLRGMGDCVSVTCCGSASVVFKAECGGVMCGVGKEGECGTIGRLG